MWLNDLSWELIERADEEGGDDPDIRDEKLVELIVKEAGKYLTSPEFIGRSDLDWDMVLKEHFGVEE